MVSENPPTRQKPSGLYHGFLPSLKELAIKASGIFGPLMPK